MTLRLEIGDDAKPNCCACCGRAGSTGHGFVYRDGDAHAVYYAAWTPAHPERGVSLAVAVGEWDDDSGVDDRTCVGLEAYEGENDILFRFVDPRESSWSDTALLGPMLTRAQAVAHRCRSETIAVAEAIVTEHPSIRNFLQVSKADNSS